MKTAIAFLLIIPTICNAFVPISHSTNKLHSVADGSLKTFDRHYKHQPSNIRLFSTRDDDTIQPSNDFFSNIISTFNKQIASIQTNTPAETEEERLRRIKREELALLEQQEVLRAEQVKTDALPYLFLLSLQLLPIIESISDVHFKSALYFFGVAVTTVYVGGRQVTTEESERVSQKSALAAPIGASISIGLLYLLIKVGLDPSQLYAVAVTLFGALAISDISVPLLRNVLPESFAEAKVPLSPSLKQVFKLDEETEDLPLDGLVTLGLGIVCTLAYWAPVAMQQKFLVSNFIAWALAMTSLGAISLGTFQTAAILLAGLFCYDIFWVFGTDVMMTVATKVEAPVKFLYSAPPVPEGQEPRAYPFSVLGLGDVVIPGLFVRFMSRLDESLQPQKFSYFNAGTIAYAVGLLVCFVVNEITHAGQPALLYLDPACIGSALACGVVNGQVQEVWNFDESDYDESK